jgi:hypothetical protein
MAEEPAAKNFIRSLTMHDQDEPKMPNTGNLQNQPLAHRDTSDGPRPFINMSATKSVLYLLALWKVDVSFNGSWIQSNAPQQAASPDAVDGYLDTDQLTDQDLIDRLVLYVHKHDAKISSGVLKAGFRKVKKKQQKSKQKEILKRILKPGAFDAEAANKEWARWSMLFDMPSSLSVACAKHSIWQVKRKAANLQVQNHLMMVIFGADQGSGKTTGVRRFASPLGDLASGDVLLSDFSDRRAGDIYRYSLVICDDLEQLSKETVPVLKSVMSASYLNRRQLQTSNSVSLRQAATLIGTANRPVHELIDDETGHRRFVMMPFRNGNEARGGDASIWEIVNSLDVQLLWDSVNHYEKSPIVPQLKDLHEYQRSYRPAPKLLRWLRELDLTGEKVRAISVEGGVRSDMLRELYIQETGDTISRQKFADEMAVYVGDETVPFSEKFKKEVGAIYRRRPRPGSAPVVTIDPQPKPPQPMTSAADTSNADDENVPLVASEEVENA